LGLVRDEDGYVSQVAELAAAAGTPINAINAGVSGETSAGGLRRIDWVLREPMDVLVLELGANDGLRGHEPLSVEANLREIIERTRARYPGTPVVIAGMQAPPNFGFAYTARFAAVFPLVAEETSSALIPFLLDSVAGIPELNQADQIHPTAEGHEILARNVWRVLAPVIETFGEEGE
jgi:acyl-CoA thioesterase I